MNCTYVRSIKTSPFEVVFGQQPNIAGIGVFPTSEKDPVPTNPTEELLEDIVERNPQEDNQEDLNDAADVPLVNFSYHRGTKRKGMIVCKQYLVVDIALK